MIEFVGVIRERQGVDDSHVSGRGHGQDDQRRLRAGLAQELGEHAGDSQHLPRSRSTGRRSRASSSRTPPRRRRCHTRRRRSSPAASTDDTAATTGTEAATTVAATRRHRPAVERTRDRDRPGRRTSSADQRSSTADSASTIRDGPATVAIRAPHSFASLTASSQSCSGATITNSGNAAAAALHVAFDRRTAVAEQDRDLARRVLRLELHAGGAQRARQVGGAVPAQRQHIGDHSLARLVGRLTLHRHDVLAERDHAVAAGTAQRDRGSSDRRRRQRLAAHRSAAVDHEAQRSVGRAPRPDSQSLDVDGDAAARLPRQSCRSWRRSRGLRRRADTAAR